MGSASPESRLSSCNFASCLLQPGKCALSFFVGLLVTLFLGEFGETDIVGQLLFQRMLTLDRFSEAVALFHQRLRTIGIIPEIGVF